MSELKPLPPHLTGGNFLLTEADPALVFTPEDLSAEQRQIAESAEEFMTKEVLPRLDALERQEPDVAVRLFRQAGELGLLAIEVPEEYGGLGLGKTTACVVENQLGRQGGFAVTCGAHTGIGSMPLTYFGTDAQKRAYLPKLASGEWMGAYALSEPDAGSDALSLRTKATRSADGTHYLLNGSKMWISNAGWADLFTLFAKVDGAHVTAFLVERAFPGVSTGKEEHKLGIKSSSTRRVVLEDARVPVGNVLGQVGKGAYIAFNILNLGRLKLAAGVLGGAKAALAGAAQYATERRQFGQPIAAFGLIQHKLAETATRICAAESALFRVARQIDDVVAGGELLAAMQPPFPRGIDEFAIECSILKVAGSETLDFAVDEALQIHGGYGYTEEFPAARAYRDARINRIFEGTNEINRLFIPTMLFRRAQRSRLPLLPAVAQVAKDALDLAPAQETGDALRNAHALLANAKKLALFLAGTAWQKLGDKLIEEQEILAALSDLLIDLYLGESAVLRTFKARVTGGPATVLTDLTLVFVNDSATRMEHSARTLLAAVSSGDDLKAQLAITRRLLRWTPLDTVEMRRRIAQRLCAVGSYAALTAGK
ncbi:MAG: acyl-CoA dehydrogenase family protein [Verrucomicrobia bacterium]|nr:acyl-CoA dehydrogenase family protein [Verrucomicrobiota bacterium]